MAKIKLDPTVQQLANELLTPGDYDIKIINASEGFTTTGKHSGSPFIEVQVGVGAPDGSLRTAWRELFILVEATQWLTQQFLICVNLATQEDIDAGKEIDLSPPDIVGARGRVRVGVRKYEARDGTEKQINEVSKWLPDKKYPRDMELAKQKFPEFFSPAADTLDDDIPF